MRVIKELKSPYTEGEKIQFIAENEGYEIVYTHDALQALGKEPADLAREIREELAEFVYNCKCAKAYKGLVINDTYLFATDERAQAMLNSTISAMQRKPDSATVDWKVYQGEKPSFIKISKVQVQAIFDKAFDVVQAAFITEEDRYNVLEQLSVAQLCHEKTVLKFKQDTEKAFNKIDNHINLEL